MDTRCRTCVETLHVNSRCVVIYRLGESAFECCRVCHIRFYDKNGQTFNPCCLKFTLLSTANVGALYQVLHFPSSSRLLVLDCVGLGQDQEQKLLHSALVYLWKAMLYAAVEPKK